ncbi:MAG: 8-amino-7-oxononanoate synthase, partial [Pseudomonadota bacterium]
MSKRGIGALKSVAKDQLLAAARASRKAGLERKMDRLVPQENERRTASSAFDFASLEGMRELRIHRAAADLLKIESPFFRVHETRASAHTRIDGRDYINFSSYDYCGLNGHPRVNAAAKAAIDTFGTSVSASRVVSGERPLHRDLERAIAD